MNIAYKILLGVCAANSLAGFALMGWTYRQTHKPPDRGSQEEPPELTSRL